MNRLSLQEQLDLQTHAAVREGKEMQNMMIRLTRNCFDACTQDFVSGRLSEKEMICISNCSSKFWQFFNRAQTLAQEKMTEQMTENLKAMNH